MNIPKIYRNKLKVFAIVCMMALPACNDYLDIVPDDGMATMETAFSMRSTAIRYLYTCYGFLTSEGNLDGDHGYITGDELWSIYDRRESGGIWGGGLFNIARGFQNASGPIANDWDGIYEGIRCCNILIESAKKVPDLPEWERLQWIAEAKFLKAWFHFHLMRKWGPIPLIRENLPITASTEQVRVYRDPMEDCFDYIIQLLDEAIVDLPLNVQSRDELGRITKPIAASIKAKIMVYAASPLFNNNSDQSTLVDKRGVKLFKTDKTAEEVKARWDAAVVACRDAINLCQEANMELYKHQSRVRVNDTIHQELDLRNVITEKWNSEIIWTNTHTSLGANRNLQLASSPNLQWDQYPDMPSLYNHINPPLKVVEMFYTNHGLPIENDPEWDGVNPYNLRTADESHRWYLRRNYTTIEMNFNREPRFYAWMGFDGGLWYGQKPEVNDPVPGDLFWVACRAGGAQQKKGYDWGPVTGYYLKKVVHYQNRQTSATGYDAVTYPWPMLRLADLYLLYAEAINESEGPNGANSSDLFFYIDKVRARAGLPGVKEAWDYYSNNPGKYNTQVGMRQIIQRERLIELSFEGQRFWDLRRWKIAPSEYEKGIYGFKVTASKPEDYYQRILLSEQKFGLKDYFWPIQTGLIEQNPNLVQNIGW
ncbi:RagB/SusD family nutrient uptake outer membrane protein [Proteiniphilum sp.]|uniref:RagB/SusD family nutrient uptake outer membrane protein n=1 Tax=Proteiniphilum sp. TaxID=1926877 RepID=UPI002B1E91EB|nr:RagB/SusD family nutrient uptake outer membrane protein [Proteiniphilum sp.]MEA4917845.1 RagB/SusD family nutrient uptake outer membrane protein [Proteiniphilum sp.]